MKIYIASPWIDRANMPAVASKVESLGHTITHKWWETEDVVESPDSHDIHAKHAILDLEGVIKADMLIVVNSSKSEGKAVEQGAALALNKPIIIIGKLGEVSKNVFHYLPSYRWVESVDEMMKVLTTIKWIALHASESE